MVIVGKEAPNFTVPAYQNGQFSSVSLSDYRGKWVVLCFYPGDFTFVWATEVSAVAERYKEYEALGIQVLTISTDSVFVHKMWEKEELAKMTTNSSIPFPMLADPCAHVGKTYGVYDEDANINVRGSFIIDPDGIVQSYEVLSPAVGRNISENLRQIQAYQFVRSKNGEQATPMGWIPGKDVLSPSPDLVGKVWEVWQPK